MTEHDRRRLETVACSLENAARALTIAAETIREIADLPPAEWTGQHCAAETANDQVQVGAVEVKESCDDDE